MEPGCCFSALVSSLLVSAKFAMMDIEVWTCVPGGKDSQPLKRKGLKNAVVQDDAALQVSKFFENPLGACMYFAQKKRFHL